jgi:PAS domain S-box
MFNRLEEFVLLIERKIKSKRLIYVWGGAAALLFYLFSLIIYRIFFFGEKKILLFHRIDIMDVAHFIFFILLGMAFASIYVAYLNKKQKAEILVKDIERKYKDLYENIQNLYCETLLDGTIIAISPSVNKILGYAENELIGRNIEEFYYEGDVRKGLRDRLLIESSIENLEIEGVKKDGRRCILLVNYKLISSGEEAPKIISIGRDITEYVEARRAQEELQKEYKLVFEKMIDGMVINEFVFDEANQPADTIIIDANPAVEKQIGLKPADIIGCSYIKSFGGNQEYMERLYQIMITGIPLEKEIYLTNFNRYLLMNAFRINPRQIGIMFHDITDLRQLEADQRKLSKQLEAVFESSEDIIYSLDKDYRILNFNTSFQNYMMRNFHRQIELGQCILEYLPEETANICKHIYQLTIQEKKHSFEYYSAEEAKYIEVFCNSIRHDGELYGIAVFAKDITEKKETEQQLIKVNEELEQRIEERTCELQSAVDELKTYTYTVSHDLKAPLRAIDGYSRIVLEDYGNVLDQEALRMIRNISDISYDMICLIDKLLQYSVTAEAELQKTVINLEELFKNVFCEIRISCMKRNIGFYIDTEITPVLADQILIRQLIYNLISNAVKFTKYREIAIIHVGCIKKEKEIICYIEDNGAGFDMKYEKKLFTIFQRLHNKEEFEGNGIGLATAYNIMQKHKGKIWIESKLNKGTKVYFTLPME